MEEVEKEIRITYKKIPLFDCNKASELIVELHETAAMEAHTDLLKSRKYVIVMERLIDLYWARKKSAKINTFIKDAVLKTVEIITVVAICMAVMIYILFRLFGGNN